jgi:hypothetical protein
MYPKFYSHPSFQHQANPIGKIKPEVTNEKKIYVSVEVLSAIEQVAMAVIITHRDR